VSNLVCDPLFKVYALFGALFILAMMVLIGVALAAG
jgi:hypothetical protein